MRQEKLQHHAMNTIYQEKYQKEHVTQFPIEEKKIGYTTAPSGSLQNLRTTARKFISGNDTNVPEGYTVEPIMTDFHCQPTLHLHLMGHYL